jgi:hypothetical protein
VPKTLNELFEQLEKDAQEAGIRFSDEQVAEKAMELLKKHANPLYSAINALGFGAAQAKLQEQVTTAKTAQTAAENRAKQAEDTLTAERGKTPEVATINSQWETKLNEARTAHERALEELRNEGRNALIERDQAQLENDLVELQVPRAVAKVLARDPDLLPKRADYDKGKLSVRQAGQSIPMTPASGQTFTQLVAKEVVESPVFDKGLLTSGGDAGSGVNGGNRPGAGDKGKWDRVRENAKKEQEGEQPRMSLEERVKSRR